MNKQLKFTAAIILFWFSMAFTSAQTGISCFHFDETNRLLLIGTISGQLYKWSTGDTVMTPLVENFTKADAEEVTDIVQINDSVFFVSVFQVGVFRIVMTKNSIATGDWHVSKPEQFYHEKFIDALAINKAKGLLYAELSLNGKGLYVSPIDKPNWRSATDGLPEYFNSNGVVVFDGDIYSISNHRRVNFIRMNRWKANQGFGLFRGSLKQSGSHDWRKIKTPDVPYHIFLMNNELYISTMDGLFKRENDSWTKVFNTRVYCLDGNNQLTIALTPCQEKLWIKQPDSGNWISLKSKLPAETGLLTACMVIEHIIIMGTDAGLLVSENMGVDWVMIKM
jgi:hypothetical protein